MSSQASSAGHSEKDVRQKIVETGDVDVMISIRSNFFYTRTVPCELWHFDRNKPHERKDKVLMLDARNVYRKVTRKIYDFSPEQMQNLAAIVWLYRGQEQRFLSLVRTYLSRVCSESAAVPASITPFETTLSGLLGRFGTLEKAAGRNQALVDAATELRDANKLYEGDAKKLLASLLYKLAARLADLGSELASDESVSAVYDRRAASRLVKQLDEERKAAVEQLKGVVYFHRQVVWLQDRFPKAELQHVPGLAKLVDIKEIEAAGWSLTPGRYVGVAPAEEDEDFDFEQTLRDIHTELADLNKEAAELAAKIQANFEELGI